MLLKLILGITLFLAITELLIPSIFGLNQGVLTGTLNFTRLNLTYSKQIETQKREEKERSLPLQGEISRMQRDKTLCFHNADCRANPDELADCNTPIHNKYYSCSTGSCGVTLEGCTGKMYLACENSKCVKKPIEL